jgi:hypothetical protein
MKGGVGKTACSVFLAMAAHLQGSQALVVDTDPTSNITVRLKDLMPSITSNNTIGDLLGGTLPQIYQTRMGFDLIPGDFGQDRKQRELDRLVADPKTQGSIRAAFQDMRDRYDLTVFDGSPRPQNAELALMREADGIILPITLDAASLMGVIFTFSRLYSLSSGEGDQELPYFFLFPWGMSLNKKNTPVVQEITQMSEKYSCTVLPVFPKIGNLTDLLFEVEDLEKLATRPEARLKKAEIAEMVQIVGRIIADLRKPR